MSPTKKLAKDRKDGQRRMGPPRPNTVHFCGRPTRDGAPCGRELQWYELACNNHASEAERAAALDLLRAAAEQAHLYGPHSYDPHN